MRLGKFILGLGMGTAIGMLLAPKKGSVLREELKTKGTKIYNDTKDMTKEDIQELVKTTIDDVKKSIDEFNIEDFKSTAGEKLTSVKIKLEELGQTIQNSEEYASLRESVKKVSEDIGNKVQEMKTKMQEKDLDAIEAIEEGIDEIEEELDVIIEDLRD